MRYTPNRWREEDDGDWSSDIAKALSRRLVGQPAAIAAVVPYVDMYRARLNPEGRPAGIFLLLGPTGTGKTKTVEALADVLHGSAKKLLKVDCGEYQMEHEVAKLLGAPPGYLGHRETQPLLTQQKLSGAASDSCDLSILLFDEIEKAAQSLVRLLLGVLDKATLRLGDSTVVNFEKSIIFMTSNLGAREMSRELHPEFGFDAALSGQAIESGDKLERIGKSAVRKNFSPEFINRIDSVVTYQPLDSASADRDPGSTVGGIAGAYRAAARGAGVPHRSAGTIAEIFAREGHQSRIWRARVETRLASSVDAPAGGDGGGGRYQSWRERAR